MGAGVVAGDTARVVAWLVGALPAEQLLKARAAAAMMIAVAILIMGFPSQMMRRRYPSPNIRARQTPRPPSRTKGGGAFLAVTSTRHRSLDGGLRMVEHGLRVDGDHPPVLDGVAAEVGLIAPSVGGDDLHAVFGDT